MGIFTGRPLPLPSQVENFALENLVPRLWALAFIEIVVIRSQIVVRVVQVVLEKVDDVQSYRKVDGPSFPAWNHLVLLGVCNRVS